MKEIIQASSQDLSDLHSLLARANQYALQLSDRPTWEDIEKANKAIEQELELGHVFVIRTEDGRIYSSITLSETCEEWGDAGFDGQALYFTKFMKDPNEVGTNAAVRLLSFAAIEAKKRNKYYLRCDALSDHQGLISYYKSFGFRERDHFFYATGREGVLLEVLIADFCLSTVENK